MNQFSAEELHLLRNCELLKNVSDKNFGTFINLSQRMSYSQDEVLLEEGKENDHLFILLSGNVNLYKSTHAKQCQIGSLSRGQSIGEMRVIKNQPCTLTVTATQPVVVLSILITQLRHLEYNQCYESILDAIINILSLRLVDANYFAINGAHENKQKQFFPLLVIATATLFLCELGVAFYYLM